MKTAWYARNWVKAVLHVLAWAVLFSLPFILRQSYKSNNTSQPAHEQRFRMLEVITSTFWILFFYFNAYVLVPRFVSRKQYTFLITSLLLAFGVLFAIHFLYFSISKDPHFSLRAFILFNIFPFLFIISCSTAYRMIKDQLERDKLVQDRERENLKTELSFLRSQVSPHFMFNVLNNMVALARKQSDQLEPSLIKLSSLMRYMLYEADEEMVPIEKETEYLQSYIDLQQQRFGKKLQLTVTFDLPDRMYEIEPMLLIPFVENAFKHGTGMITDARIEIHLAIKNGMLYFTVRNKYEERAGEVKDRTSGIGLTNVKRRLNLLYGANHSLLLSKHDGWFVASLQLNLH